MKQRLLKSMLLLCALVVGGVSSAWADVVTIWSENFDGLSENATPTAPTNNAYAGVTYSCVNGAGTSPGNTKIMSGNLAEGASAPELMVGKKGSGTGAAGGKFVAVIPLDNFEGTLTLTYYQNKQSLKVSSPTTGVSGGQTLKPSQVGQQTTTFTGITTSMTSITIEFEATTTNNVRLDDIVLTGTKATGVATPAFSPAAGAYTSAQNVTISCTDNEATIYYTMGENPSDPTSSSTPYTGPIAVNTNTTIKAIAIKGNASSPVATAAYTIVSLEHAGTEQDPYTVADAYTAIDGNVGVTSVCATGIVSQIVTAWDSGFKNISFNISTDGSTTSNQLQAYRCASSTEADASQVNVGDIVVVSGNLVKYGNSYQFAQGCQLVSLEHPTTPVIVATPTSLTGFTYVAGNGPSEAQSFSVEGTNLEGIATLSLGESSSYELSFDEHSGYDKSLTIELPTGGTVGPTTVYVRLKAGLDINASYNGTITITSTGATDKTISLSGSVESANYVWDLSTDQTTTASESEMTWVNAIATIAAAKGDATTATNNYYPSTPNQKYTSTRFYKNSTLTITPASGCTITSVVFTATTEGYATTLKNSTWGNATATADVKTVTVTPTSGSLAISAAIGGTCGFTDIKIYYSGIDVVTGTITDAGYTTFVSNKKLDFTNTDIKAYTAKCDGDKVKLTEINVVPANTPIVVYKDVNAAGTFVVPVSITKEANIVVANDLLASDGSVVGATGIYALGNKNSVVGFYKVKDGEIIPAGKCYLNTNASTKEFLGFSIDDDETAIESLTPALSKGEGAIYNLAGQRLNKLQKGLNIVGGKKVMY